jgi:hypothetical protein
VRFAIAEHLPALLDVHNLQETDGARVQTSSPGELHDLLMAESERWHSVVLQAGLRPDVLQEGSVE